MVAIGMDGTAKSMQADGSAGIGWWLRRSTGTGSRNVEGLGGSG